MRYNVYDIFMSSIDLLPFEMNHIYDPFDFRKKKKYKIPRKKAGNQILIQNLIVIFTGRVLTCYCEGQCPDNTFNGECETRPGGYCFTSVDRVYDENGKEEMEYTYGCMPPEHSGGLLQVGIPSKCYFALTKISSELI